MPPTHSQWKKSDFQASKLNSLLEEKLNSIEGRLQKIEEKIQSSNADKPLIFLGPSLSIQQASEILAAEYRPPIRRGDLPKVVNEGYRWIGIVDGVFHHRLTVSIEEIRQACKRGAQLYGSSSMGALRAAETYPLGMVGVGQIYEWYADETVDADDEVAIAFVEETGKALSEPLVNIRATLNQAKQEKLIDAQEWEVIFTQAAQLHFSKRTYTQLCQVLQNQLSSDKIQMLKNYFSKHAIDLKAQDAQALLKRLKADYEQARNTISR